MSKNDGGPAFPTANDRLDLSWGMTLRDYFASAAVPAIISVGAYTHSADIAAHAYKFADAMLAERDK